MRRVKKRGKKRFSFSFLLIVFLIAFILLASVYFFIFSIVGTSDFWQIISGQKRAMDVEKFGREIESTLEDGRRGGRPSADETVYLHAPSSGIVPGFGKGFIDLPIVKLDLYPVPTISSNVVNGNWEDANSWDLGRIPQAGDVVLVRVGHSISFNSVSPDITAVNIDGTLKFSRTSDSKLNVGYIYVRQGGLLDMGSVSESILDPISAEIHFLPIKDASDDQEIGPGITVMGRMITHGQPREDTFVRTSTAPSAGATTISFEKDVQSGGANGIGWKVGDRVVIPDSEWRPDGASTVGTRTEERTITGWSLCSLQTSAIDLTLSSLRIDNLKSRVKFLLCLISSEPPFYLLNF